MAVGYESQQFRGQPVAEQVQSLGLSGHFHSGDIRRFAEADNTGHILGAGTLAPLLAAAGEQRVNPGALSDVEGSGTLGPVELVAGSRQHVGVQVVDVDRQVADRLDGIDMK